MKKFCVAILLLICMAASVDAVTVRCNFDSNTWAHVTGSFYRCIVQNREDFTASVVSIDAAVGTHTGDKDNDDVTEFCLSSAPNLVHFPKNLDKVFPDLKVIAIEHTKLQAITQDDLKVFPKLKVAYFYDNKLKVITADTFRFNLKLERIDLDSNLIFHIEPHTFDGLKKLTALYVSGNDKNCNLTSAETKTDTAALVQKVNNVKCYSVIYDLQQKHENFTKMQQQQNEKVDKQMKEFEVLMSQMLIQIQILTKKVENNV
jgi:Leucine-rich repeat (LRR) protein